MDFRNGFDLALLGACVWTISSIILPILKLFNVIKLNWWLCLLPLGIFLLFGTWVFVGMIIIGKSLEKEKQQKRLIS